MQQIHDFIDVYDDIPYTVMMLLCGDVNYGGRVTDDKDRRCMNSILSLYITPQVMDDSYTFSQSGLFYCPADNPSRDHYLDYCASLPINPSPEIQGLHDNADITCAQNEMIAMFETIVSLGGGGSGGGNTGAKSPDEIVYSLCESYLAQIPKPLNL